MSFGLQEPQPPSFELWAVSELRVFEERHFKNYLKIKLYINQ